MYEVSKCAPQEALRDLEKAYKHFYRKRKLKAQRKFRGKLGFPAFKKRSKGIGSFRLTGSIKVFADGVQLPRLGRLRVHEHGYLPTEAKVLSATVSEQTGRWYVFVQKDGLKCGKRILAVQILKDVIFPLTLCLILVIAGLVIEGMYAPPAGPYINSLSGLCFLVASIIATATGILNMPKRR